MNIMPVLSDSIGESVRSTVPLILAIVGNDEDYELVRYSFEQSPIETRLHRCQNEKQALDYIKQSMRNKQLIPTSILLEVSLTDTKGLQILRTIKHNATLSCIPTVILASSNRDKNGIEKCCFFGANTYLLKIADLTNANFQKSIFAVIQYWFNTMNSNEFTNAIHS
jgi:response regulator of citrate/malate metabolism